MTFAEPEQIADIGLPKVYIVTPEGVGITSKTEWLENCSIRIVDENGVLLGYVSDYPDLMQIDPDKVIYDISGALLGYTQDGKCYDTTMGLTPLDGLMMGTRSGAIDPSILEFVCKESGKDVSEITNELNKKSGYRILLAVATFFVGIIRN